MPTAKLKIVKVPVERIHPNPWNPNRQDDRTYQANRESIRTFGFIDPVTARPHPDIDGDWQIIDGEHRFRAAQDEGMTEVDLIPLKLDDNAAKKLTVILNEARGEADVALLGELLSSLEMELDELQIGLPYSSTELDHLLSLGSATWGDFEPGLPGPGAGDDESEGQGNRLIIDLTDQADLIEKMREQRQLEGPKDVILYALGLVEDPV
jgi:hypothetical protein